MVSIHEQFLIMSGFSGTRTVIHFPLIQSKKEISTTSLPDKPCQPVWNESLLSKAMVYGLLQTEKLSGIPVNSLFYIHLIYPYSLLWSQYEIKKMLAPLWPRTDVYARKPLAQKYMNVPHGPDGLFITSKWLIAMLSHTPTFKISDIVWKFLGMPIYRTLLCDSFYFKVWRNKTTKAFNLIGKFNRFGVFLC